MSTTATPSPAGTGTPLTGRLAVVSVMLGIFAIVTTEILPIGLLSPIGASFSISDGTAGLMMTLPGILAALSAPVVTVATGRLDRRHMLCLLILILALANFLAASAQDYRVMIFARILVGLVIGGFWSIGAGLAPRLVAPQHAGRATAVIFSAVPLGSVLGVPAGTLLGNLLGWRAAFIAMGILAIGVLVALTFTVPSLPPQVVTRMAVLRDALRAPGARTGLLVTFLIVTAHFGAYTYITPFLADVTDASPATITVLLLVYGVAGVAGNFTAGARAGGALRATFGLAAACLATATLALPLLGTGNLAAIILLTVWGMAYGAVPVCSQTWFVKSVPHSPEAASVLFTTSFQATIAVGALAGGFIVDFSSPSTVMLAGGAVAAIAGCVIWRLNGPGESRWRQSQPGRVRRQ